MVNIRLYRFSEIRLCSTAPESRANKMTIKEKYLIEDLALEEHRKWSRWMRHLLSRCKQDKEGNMIIPAHYVYQWIKTGATSYENLEEKEKANYKIEARNTFKIVTKYLFQKEK